MGELLGIVHIPYLQEHPDIKFFSNGHHLHSTWSTREFLEGNDVNFLAWPLMTYPLEKTSIGLTELDDNFSPLICPQELLGANWSNQGTFCEHSAIGRGFWPSSILFVQDVCQSRMHAWGGHKRYRSVVSMSDLTLQMNYTEWLTITFFTFKFSLEYLIIILLSVIPKQTRYLA